MNQNIFVTEGNRPLWQRIVAAAAFTACIAALGLVGLIAIKNQSFPDIGSCIDVWVFATSMFLLGVRYSFITNIYLDLKQRLYKKEFAVGPVRVGKWENLPNIEYICVFRQAWTKDRDGNGQADAAGYNYDVNVWHDTSKHFTIYSCPELKASFEVARYLAQKLNVDLLDASVPTDKRWITLEDNA